MKKYLLIFTLSKYAVKPLPLGGGYKALNYNEYG